MEQLLCFILMFSSLMLTRNGLCQNYAESSVYDVETDEPTFLTKGHLFKAVVGDTITLPCMVRNLGSYVLLWRRGQAVLTANSLMVTRDSRFKLIDGFNLQMSKLNIQDAGDYVCQIGDQEPRDMIHTIEVLVPATVRSIPDHGLVSARQGSSVTLECKASGNPVPHVHWRKKDSQSTTTSLGDGSILMLERVDRQHAGIYQCIADNGVGGTAYSDVTLKVLSPPAIEVEKAWIHASDGCEVELICTLHGDLNSDVTWYQNSFMFEADDRRTMFSRGEKFILNIKNFHRTDFGNYSCVADNALGRTKKYIFVSGRPGPTEFLPTFYSHSDRYNLTFRIESIPDLDEIKLLYRKLMMNETYQKPGQWKEIILYPSATRHDSHHFVMSYIIKPLEHNSVYEVMVQAKNRYGWNEVSDIHQFLTRNYGTGKEDMDFIMSSVSFSIATSQITTSILKLCICCMTIIQMFIFPN